MFPVPISLRTCVEGAKDVQCPLWCAVVKEWKQPDWKCEYVEPSGMNHGHILITDKLGYRIGAVVYKTCGGVVVVRLENPAGIGLSEWNIPYTGFITAKKIIDALEMTIMVYETEEIEGVTP